MHVEGAWHDVVPAEGALLVNLGDLLAQWTNDTWRSTLHRVLPPARGARRRSAAFFHEANHDAVISCLPSCHVSRGGRRARGPACQRRPLRAHAQGPARPAKYPPVRAADHLLGKLLGPRKLAPSAAVDTSGGRLAGDGSRARQ